MSKRSQVTKRSNATRTSLTTKRLFPNKVEHKQTKEFVSNWKNHQHYFVLDYFELLEKC